jgi:hypothetical protein
MVTKHPLCLLLLPLLEITLNQEIRNRILIL